MGVTGWLNPLPFDVGGGTTTVQDVYRTMRAVVGVGGAGPEDSLEDLPRQTRAYGTALAIEADERASDQYYPSRSTDALGYYESLLAVPLAPDLETHERQQLVSSVFTAPPATSAEDVDAGLLAIDARLSVLTLPDEFVETTQHGRAFEDLAGTEPFNGGRKSTAFGNHSTTYLLSVLFDIGSGTPVTPLETAILSRAAQYLNEALPAWVTFQFVTSAGNGGFILDNDLLDLTAL